MNFHEYVKTMIDFVDAEKETIQEYYKTGDVDVLADEIEEYLRCCDSEMEVQNAAMQLDFAGKV